MAPVGDGNIVMVFSLGSVDRYLTVDRTPGSPAVVRNGTVFVVSFEGVQEVSFAFTPFAFLVTVSLQQQFASSLMWPAGPGETVVVIAVPTAEVPLQGLD